ncbi:MAG: SDR family NAD(P)-dependent oxidoreductase, partial [Pseudomonadota bacterium]
MRSLITGANRGIGAALRQEGERRGHDILSTHRGPAAKGWLTLDVTSEGDQRSAAAQTGAIDLLICNAGVLRDKGKTFAETSAADWSETLAANVTGTALTVQAQLANLSEGGRIAIISSMMGMQSRTPGNTMAYRASKAAVTNLGRNLAWRRPRLRARRNGHWS